MAGSLWVALRTWAVGDTESAAFMNALAAASNFLYNGVGVFTEVTSTSASTSGTTELVIASQAFTADGTTQVTVEFSSHTILKTVATDTFNVYLYDGPTAGSGTQLAAWNSGNAATTSPSVYARKILTPTAGAHTYTARLVRTVGTGTAQVYAAASVPMCISVRLFN